MATEMLGPSYSSMRAENIFTDAVVRSESGREWSVHKVILSRLGSFFFNAFSFPSFSGTLKLGVSDDAVQCIVDLAYEGVCNVTEENALETLTVALMYQLKPLIEVCIDFISAQMITPGNIFTVKAFVRFHQDALKEFTDGAFTDAVNKWMTKNFSYICTNEQIYELPYEELEAVVGEDDLNIQEEELMELILKYIKKKKLNREESTKLLANVRQVLIDPSKLSQIIQENQSLTFEIEKSRETYNTHRPRYPREMVIAIGNDEDDDDDHGEVFDLRKNEWNPIEVNRLSLEFFKEGHRYVIVGNIIYCLKFERFQDEADSWIQIKSIDIMDGRTIGAEYVKFPAQFDHLIPEVIAWNGGILSFMAYWDEKIVGAFYDPSEKSWSPFPTSEDIGYSSTILVADGILFAIGGFTDPDLDEENRSSKIAYYDVQSEAWSVCGLLKSVSGFNRAAMVEGKVFVFPCGKEGNGECFQPFWENGRITVNWFPTIKMPWEKRDDFEISVIDNKLLFTGVEIEGNLTKECQMFSPRTGEWSVVAESKNSQEEALTVNLNNLGMKRIEELCCGKILKTV